MSPPDSLSTLRTFAASFLPSTISPHFRNLFTTCLSTHRHLSRHNRATNNKRMNHTTVDSAECAFLQSRWGSPWGPLFEGRDCTESSLISGVKNISGGLSATSRPYSYLLPSRLPPGPEILSLLLSSTHFFAPEPLTGPTNSNCLSTSFLPSLKWHRHCPPSNSLITPINS